MGEDLDPLALGLGAGFLVELEVLGALGRTARFMCVPINSWYSIRPRSPLKVTRMPSRGEKQTSE